MFARWIGIPCGFIVFILFAYLFSCSFGPGLPFIAGALGAWRIWWHCHQLDKQQFEKMLNPPAEIWEITLPLAWGVIKDVFDCSTVNLDRSGLVSWRLEKEDQARGFMVGNLSFDEVIGHERNVYRRTIIATATLAPDGENTCVQLKYEVFSPMGTRMVEGVIASAFVEFASKRKSLQVSARI